ncbi:MAG: hypothetical protein AAFW65_00940 [Pseudomonadota bacterium]
MQQPRTLPLAYETEDKPKAIVFGDAGYLELEMAEPSPLMVSASRLWRRSKLGAKVLAVCGLIGFYPAMMAHGHRINDAPVSLNHGLPWAAPEAGVAVTLIAREIYGPGWASDREAWHPQAHLRAMPAWQAGLANALSEHTALSASLLAVAGSPDSDLEAAVRLLRAETDLEMAPRLAAAAEALARYDGRAARNLAVSVRGEAALAAELRLFADWADRSKLALDDKAGSTEGWMATDGDVDAFYTAKARAHVAHELLGASARAEPKLMASAAMRAEIRKAELVWRKAATQQPLLVYNRGDDFLGMNSHLENMANIMEDAATTSRALADLLETPPESMYVAQVDPSLLTASP